MAVLKMSNRPLRIADCGLRVSFFRKEGNSSLAVHAILPALVLLAAACLAQGPPARVSPSRARTEAAKADSQLIAEFKAGAPVGDRTEAQLQADADRVVKLLLASLGETAGSRYRVAQARADLERVCQRSLRPDDDRPRRAVCKALAESLDRDADCQSAIAGLVAHMLQEYGGAECVEPLARMLAGAAPERRELARCALEAIDAPAAGDKLRQALFAAVDQKWQVGLIDSLGARQGAASVDWIARMLKDRDPAVACAAAAALGQIGNADAIGVLNDLRLLATGELRLAICDALLACAQKAHAAGNKDAALTIWRKMYENPTEVKLVRIAALRAMVATQGPKAAGVVVGLLAGDDQAIRPVAMELAREIPGEPATRAFVELLGKAPDDAARAEMIDLLGARGDGVAREAILAELRQRKWRDAVDGKLRQAVIRALGGVGTEADAMLLVRLAVQAGEAGAEDRNLARSSLRQLRGEQVNAALLAGLGENDPAVRREVISALASRGAVEAATGLLGLVADSDPGVRYTALDALARVGDERALLALVQWFCRAPTPAEARACERAMASICQRTEAQDLVAASIAEVFAKADVKAKCALMQSCSDLSGPKALETLAIGVADPNELVQEAALKALAHSSEPGAADVLLRVARTAERKDQKTLALSGYIRLAQYQSLPVDKKIWAYIQIMDLAQQPAQRKLAVKSLGDIRSAGALTLALDNIRNPELAAEAESAACRIGLNIYTSNPEEVVAAMQRVTGTTASSETLKEARRIQALAQEVLDKRKAATAGGKQ
jgi:HEAT repeat protein